ncbi:MAG: hypothetical protein M8860_03050 [marine benthic group bacterium]|nr:hypothetical protein [Gemmatimonadota bacterium]MCL7961817.1 hypothetical protein [Candidatus Carthagonibacter metallireducens]MCL7937636.1 hypothetical protein [Gemmatimonadota bacterium]MCL7957649.1 hypothetical protein [Gemmatimonadota bacterium]MCL7964823.1 hypothetical protein [Gemmatimonadota bacterium]
MRSATTALAVLILLSACTPDADPPTSVTTTPPPDRVTFTMVPSGSTYLLDSTYTVSIDATSGSDPVTQAEETAVEQAFDSLAVLFDHANDGLPEFSVVYGQTGDIQVMFDGDDSDEYYCGGASGGVITLERFSSSATDCGTSGGQLTSKLAGLVMHEFGEEVGAVPLANVNLDTTDLTYLKCIWPHYSYNKNSGYPSQLCRWDEQWVYALFELRPSPPTDFYENSLIVNVALTASGANVLRYDTVTFTASLTQWNGVYESSADEALKTWWKDGGMYVSPAHGDSMYVDVKAGASDETLVVRVTVDDSTGYAVWPWGQASDTVLVTDPVPTSVTLPDSLVLTDDNDSTLYQDLTAVTTPADPNGLYDYDWTIGNTNIARIVGGGRTVTIEGYSAGTTTVIVEVEETVSDTTTVVVDCGTKRNPSCIQYGPIPM